MLRDDRVFAEGELLIRFPGEGLLPVGVVGESLVAWGALYARVPSVLSVYHPVFRHLRLIPFVEQIESGSLSTRIIARILMKDPQAALQFEQELDALSDLAIRLVLENIAKMNTSGKIVIGSVVGAALIHGIINIGGYLDKDARGIVNSGSGIVLNNCAINLNVTPGKVSEMVDLATKDNVRLTRQTISALRPSAILSDGKVEIGELGTNVVIDSAAASIISRVDPDSLKPRIDVRPLRNVAIDIRAIDLDKKKSGWAVILSKYPGKRIPLTVPESLKLQRVGQFMADVDVDVAIDLNGVEKPKKAHLLKIIK